MVRRPPFQHFKKSDVQDCAIPKTYFSKGESDLFLNSLEAFGVSEVKINGLGSHGHVRNSKMHGNVGLSSFPKMKSKSY